MLRTAGTTAGRSEWRCLQDASFVRTKQQVRATESPHSRHPGGARQNKILGRETKAPFAFFNQSATSPQAMAAQIIL